MEILIWTNHSLVEFVSGILRNWQICFKCSIWFFSGGNTLRTADGNIFQTDWSGNRGSCWQRDGEGGFEIWNSFDRDSSLHSALFGRRERLEFLEDIAELFQHWKSSQRRIFDFVKWKSPETSGSSIPSHITEYCPFSRAEATPVIGYCGNMIVLHTFIAKLCASLIISSYESYIWFDDHIWSYDDDHHIIISAWSRKYPANAIF